LNANSVETENLKPCPFCGSQDLRLLDITLANDDGEVDVLAAECLNCDAQAPAAVWNERVPEDRQVSWQEKLAMQDGDDGVLAL
jgi:NADH:ubiquinone oxidoreductase subunit E